MSSPCPFLHPDDQGLVLGALLPGTTCPLLVFSTSRGSKKMNVIQTPLCVLHELLGSKLLRLDYGMAHGTTNFFIILTFVYSSSIQQILFTITRRWYVPMKHGMQKSPCAFETLHVSGSINLPDYRHYFIISAKFGAFLDFPLRCKQFKQAYVSVCAFSAGSRGWELDGFWCSAISI